MRYEDFKKIWPNIQGKKVRVLYGYRNPKWYTVKILEDYFVEVLRVKFLYTEILGTKWELYLRAIRQIQVCGEGQPLPAEFVPFSEVGWKRSGGVKHFRKNFKIPHR